MWNLFMRLGMVLSTVLIGKQFVDYFWSNEIRPTRLYNPEQVARYLGTSNKEIVELIQSGDIGARWVDGEPVILGAAILDFLSRGR